MSVPANRSNVEDSLNLNLNFIFLPASLIHFAINAQQNPASALHNAIRLIRFSRDCILLISVVSLKAAACHFLREAINF